MQQHSAVARKPAFPSASPKPLRLHNPYGDSVSLLYGIFSEVTGPFCTYNYAKGDFEGRLAERWKIENPTTWIFYLEQEL